MPRVYVASIPPDEPLLRLTGDSARYMLNVLRCREGQEFIIFDSTGSQFQAEIKKTSRGVVVLELKGKLQPLPEPRRPVVLLQGMLKGQKMDTVVRMATELGVREIVPVVSERSQVRESRKQPRWRKIALEAARQSGRTFVPEVREPVGLEEYLSAQGGNLEGYIFWEEGGRSLKDEMIKESENPLVVAVGPEGGFTASEVRFAEGKGLKTATLGRRILRADTASVSTLTLIQFLLGEM